MGTKGVIRQHWDTIMRPLETAQFAGLFITQALESTDVREVGANLQKAERLLSQLQELIDEIRQSAPDAMEVMSKALIHTRHDLTVSEEKRQNRMLKGAVKRSRSIGLPSGIKNY